MYAAIGNGVFNVKLCQVDLLQEELLNVSIWHVLNPGDYLFVASDVAGACCWVSGAVLIGAPELPSGELATPRQYPPA